MSSTTWIVVWLVSALVAVHCAIEILLEMR
jgi:hypothetical protein